MKTSLRRIGNSLGVIVPRAMLVQASLADEVEMTVEKGAIVLRKPSAARSGWAQASAAVAASREDTLAPDAWIPQRGGA